MSKRGQVLELTRVRLLLFRREPELFFWVFVFPLLLALVLGFAFRRTGPGRSAVAVVAGAAGDALAASLAADEGLDVERPATAEEARRGLARARIDVLVTPGEPPVLAFDPERAETETARLRVRAALARAAGSPPPELVLEPVAEHGSRYIDFLAPGLIGMNVMGTGLWGIAFAIVQARGRHFLKRLLVTPLWRPAWFLSFLLSRSIFLVLEILVLALFAVLVLGVPFRCSPLDFALLNLIAAFAFAGIGLLLASRPRTVEAVSGLLNLAIIPMWLGSGVFFSYERLPAVLHPFLRALPLTALNDALRALMLDGDGLAAHAGAVGTLLAWAVVSFLLAARVFRWD